MKKRRWGVVVESIKYVATGRRRMMKNYIGHMQMIQSE